MTYYPAHLLYEWPGGVACLVTAFDASIPSYCICQARQSVWRWVTVYTTWYVTGQLDHLNLISTAGWEMYLSVASGSALWLGR